VPVIIELLAAIGGSAILAAVEGLRVRTRRDEKQPDPQEGAKLVALKVAASEAEKEQGVSVSVAATPPVPPHAHGTRRHDQSTKSVRDETRALEERLAAVGGDSLELDRNQFVRALQSELADPATRALLGLPNSPGTRRRVAQGAITCGMVIFIVYALAADTETGVAFAFMGSICGFWMREFAA
jgi:hypothetical protein